MSVPQHKRLKKAIFSYKFAVDDALAELRRPFILDSVFIVIIPAALSVIAFIFSNVAGFLTTLGLGGINAEERLRKGQSVLKSYLSERSKLKRSVKRLEIELLLYSPSNTAGLQKLENLLLEYLDALELNV